jgi:RHS repeat-associated protein
MVERAKRAGLIPMNKRVHPHLMRHTRATRLVTQSGSVVFSTNYEPFGAPYAASGTDPSVKYTGQWSEAAGLYWNHARFYDPTLGRFVSADSVLGSLARPQTENRYAYVANNPLKYVDSNGKFLNIIIGAVAGAIIGGLACAWANGWSWSNQCWIDVGVGAVAGAVAGATFNPALGLFVAEGATASFAATVAAGAISGAIAGAAGYGAKGGLLTLRDGSFQWSAEGLVQSVVFGAAGGALGAGVGYGVFGAPIRAPIRTLWSLPASLKDVTTQMGTSLTRTGIATAVSEDLGQNVIQGAVDQLAEGGLQRLLPSTTGPISSTLFALDATAMQHSVVSSLTGPPGLQGLTPSGLIPWYVP